MTDSADDTLTASTAGLSPTVVSHVEGEAVIIGDNARQQISYYGDIIVRVDSLEELPPKPGEPPYKGLTYYTEADEAIFFGREQLSDDLAARLQTTPFLAVAGASGSGKSSLLRAGVIPRLRRRNWLTTILTPTADPLGQLAAGLCRDETDLSAADALRAQLAADPQTLRRKADQLLARAGAGRLLLIVDQFEELFTQCHDEAGRRAFIDNLLAAARANGRATVLIGLRADFMGRLTEVEELRALVEQNFALLGPMQQEDLVRVIAEPARIGGWAFVSGLVEQFLSDVGQEPGRLPLLSHALLETWARRAGHVMTLKGYRAAGGVEGAIAKTAEDTLRRLDGPGEQAIVQAVFLSLTELGEGSEDTRRIALRDELARAGDPAAVDAVLNTLAGARLVTLEADSVQVAHEALIRRWPRLREWLADNRERLRFERQLEADAAEWQRLRRDPGALYRGARLVQAQEWMQNGRALSPLVSEFMSASAVEAEEEARQAQQLARAGLVRRFLYIAAGLAAVAVLAAIIAGIFGYQQNQTAGALSIETTRAVSAEVDANEARATSEFNEAEAQAARATSEANAEEAVSAEATAVVAQGEAEAARAEVERLNRVTRAQRLAAEAENLLVRDPEDALLLAAAAYQGTNLRHGTTTGEARAALYHALASPYETTLMVYENETFMPLIEAGRTEENVVWSPAFSPDGTRVMTASWDGVARLWDAASGEMVAALEGHEGMLTSAEFNSDGTHMVTASSDGTARLWDVATGEELHRLVGHEGLVNTAVFSSDGTFVVTASGDGTARLWDVATGEELHRLVGPEGGVNSAVFSPDGTFVATAGGDGAARLWDAENGAELAVLQGPGDGIRIIVFSPDGTRVVTVSDGTPQLWDVESGMELGVLIGHESMVQSVAFSSDGTQLVTAGADETARLWDVASREELAVLAGHEGWVNSAVFSPDGMRVLTASEDMTARLWDAKSGAELTMLAGHRDRLTSAVFSPDGTRIVTTSRDGTARLWDVRRGMELATMVEHTMIVNSAAFNPDGTQVATAGWDLTVRVWDAESGEAPAMLEGHDDLIRSVAFSPNGEQLVTASHDGTARLWDVASREELAVLEGHEGWVMSAVFNPDGTKVITTGLDGTVRLWDTGTRTELAILSLYEAIIDHPSFSPETSGIVAISADFTRLVISGADGMAWLWDLASSDPAVELAGHRRTIFSAAFSPDGTMVVTTSADGTARVWKTVTGELLAVLDGHKDLVWAAAFSPDGTRVVTASWDETARLWDATSGRQLDIFTGDGDKYSAVFSPDGSRVVTAANNGTVRIWAVAAVPLEMIAEAQRRLQREPTAIIPDFCSRYYQDAPDDCPDTLAKLFPEDN